jgi:serine/threonine protein kinase
MREVGRGGMGVVFLGEDCETGERCAVKILHPHLPEDETSLMRFQTETRAASAIDHPAIIKLRGDIGRLADGRWYFAMEYLDGLTLAQLVAQRGPLPLAVIIEILAPICEALDMAHARNIIHRDLKPDNVIATLHADGYVPKLLDFGIAKLLDEPAVTQPGATPGTTAHMAPEQLRGDAVDRRCDVYALGVLAYKMITGGCLPYDAPDSTLYHAQMTRPPIDPRQRCPAVPAVAVSPILSAIHTDPAQRPTTAGAFVLMLARVLVGSTPQTDGMAIVQRVAPRLLQIANHHETLRAPGITSVRGSTSWSYSYGTPLGKGGFGEVFRGVKHGAPGFALPVAIKRIRREYADDPTFVEMFHQEARIAALLGEHPNIVKVLDHATDPFGQLAIVMEFIDGVDLDKLCQSGPLPYSIIIYIIGEVLEGLGYAHHLPLPGVLSSAAEIAARGEVRGIIHRDMSHHNVMLSWHGAVKVMDFGIAKLREQTAAPGSVMIKGKPGYMSPEQATTNVAIDGRADLFAVGIMLWELLAGRHLFYKEDDLQATIAGVLFASIKAPSHYCAEVPPELEAVALRLLERDPSNRYQTAHEAHAALMTCSAASRSAKAQLQQLLRVRFPERAAHAPTPAGAEPAAATTAADSPHALDAPWQPESTTHSHATGQPTADAAGRRRRASRLALVVVGAGLGSALAVAVLMARHDSQSTPNAQAPAPPPAVSSLPPQSSAAPARSPANNPSGPALPAMSSLAIVTEPADVMVRVENATKQIASGRSPLTVSVPQGARIEIHADAPGYEPATKAIVIGDPEQQTVVLALVASTHPVPSPTTNDPLPTASVPTAGATPLAKPPVPHPRPLSRPATKPTEPDDKILE